MADDTKIFRIPIIKSKGDFVEVNAYAVPDTMMDLIFAEGLKALVNAKMSKITTAKLEGEALEKAKADARAIAETNVAAILAGTFTKGRPSANTTADGTKIPAEVVAEARRLARNAIKDAMRAANIKISHVPVKEITSSANELIQKDPRYYEMAAANIAKRKEQPLPVDIASMVKVDPKLVAKAEAEKAERKAQLSAKQAGKVAKRAAPVPPAKGSTAPAPATVQ